MQISDVQVSFDGDSTELEDIARCVRNIILTPAAPARFTVISESATIPCLTRCR